MIIDKCRGLNGTVRLTGAKNSILPLLSATLLTKEPCVFKNVPLLSDVKLACDILGILGSNTKIEDDTVYTIPNDSEQYEIPPDLMSGMRSSFMFLGAMLAKHKKAVVYSPDGCNLGLRPVDIHISALSALGAEFSNENGKICSYLPKGRFIGTTVELRFPSVGATENAMMAAATAQGLTTIIGAAKEPEIADLARFLNACGAKIRNAGQDIITIEGVEELHGAVHTVIPDRILASTLISATAITKGCIELKNIAIANIDAVTTIFREIGCEFYVKDDSLTVYCGSQSLKATKRVECAPFPAFPTDAGPLLAAALAFAYGKSEIYDAVFENRFSVSDQFNRLGAETSALGRSLFINGKQSILGGTARASDLRGGAALLCLALGCENGAEIYGIEHIDRGYYKIENLLNSLGANLRRLEVEQEEKNTRKG